MVNWLAFLSLLLSISTSFTQELDGAAITERGAALAERMCSECHAIGRDGFSAHPHAPAFRQLGHRLDLDVFSDRLRESFSVYHPDMPTVRFSREDARALVRYLRSIQAQ
jgi:mono/diheme cytochrome c family protein